MAAAHPADAAHALDLGTVDEREKAWLYAHAALVLYPTVREGFGLVPFEAAAAGAATLWAAHSSLEELLPVQPAGIVAWDPVASATGPRSSWPTTRSARGSWQPCARPPRRYAGTAQARRWSPSTARPPHPRCGSSTGPRAEPLTDLALSLVGAGGYVPPDVQQALLAVSTRPALRRRSSARSCAATALCTACGALNGARGAPRSSRRSGRPRARARRA